jgi:hypothetical protein
VGDDNLLLKYFCSLKLNDADEKIKMKKSSTSALHSTNTRSNHYYFYMHTRVREKIIITLVSKRPKPIQSLDGNAYSGDAVPIISFT